MAIYLVSAQPRAERLDELASRLAAGEIAAMRPFGSALDAGLRGARRAAGGRVEWEEEDYCSPPLAEERAAVLDRYFTAIEVEPVPRGFGWARVRNLPLLFPGLAPQHTNGG